MDARPVLASARGIRASQARRGILRRRPAAAGAPCRATAQTMGGVTLSLVRLAISDSNLVVSDGCRGHCSNLARATWAMDRRDGGHRAWPPASSAADAAPAACARDHARRRHCRLAPDLDPTPSHRDMRDRSACCCASGTSGRQLRRLCRDHDAIDRPTVGFRSSHIGCHSGRSIDGDDRRLSDHVVVRLFAVARQSASPWEPSEAASGERSRDQARGAEFIDPPGPLAATYTRPARAARPAWSRASGYRRS